MAKTTSNQWKEFIREIRNIIKQIIHGGSIRASQTITKFLQREQQNAEWYARGRGICLFNYEVPKAIRREDWLKACKNINWSCQIHFWSQ